MQFFQKLLADRDRIYAERLKVSLSDLDVFLVSDGVPDRQSKQKVDLLPLVS
jgi:hypothetical protein